MKTIGFFGGSFDPIHFGHLHLAKEMLKTGNLDEVLFCPALCSPFKVERPPAATGFHRLEMILRSVASIPSFQVTPIEIESEGPSFTIQTLRKLQKPNTRYRLILSQEAASQFHQWKEPVELVQIAPPLVGPRSDISSTEIRDRLKKKLYCGHLVPGIALDYIAQNHLYC